MKKILFITFLLTYTGLSSQTTQAALIFIKSCINVSVGGEPYEACYFTAFEDGYGGGTGDGGTGDGGTTTPVTETEAECEARIDNYVADCKSSVVLGASTMGGSFCVATTVVVAAIFTPLAGGFYSVGCGTAGALGASDAITACENIGTARKLDECP